MKKLASLILILVLLLQLVIVQAPAVAAAEAVDAVQDRDVEQLILQNYAKADIPADAVEISSAAAFATMNAAGTYYLSADITVLSTYSAAFAGKLYGNGHTVTVAGTRPVFGTLQGAEIYDLTVVGSVSVSAEYTGGLAAKAYDSTLVGIANEADICNTKKGYFAGGIVGYAEDTVLRYCTNRGAITGHTGETRLGGLVGQMDNAEGTLTLQNCINYGAVTGVNQTGGLVSRVQNGAAVTFENCANFGTVTVSYSDGGGIIGKVTATTTAVTFRGCYNSARITGATYTGGLVGPLAASALTVEDCHNGCFVKGCLCNGTDHGKITNKSDAPLGGLISNFWCQESEAVFMDCTNSGDLSSPANSRVGGIAAVMECSSVAVINCHNSGDLESLGYVGGVFARLGAAAEQGTVTVEDCSNSGEIHTNSYAGGIVGYQQYGAELSFTRCTNSGAITTGWNVGGILARTDGGRTACTMTFTDCTNTADLQANGTSGGIVGIFTGTYDLIKRLTFTNCTNTGDITSPNYSGGISGITDVKVYNAINCRNEGDINVVDQNDETSMAGGIAARTYGAATFTDCLNTGNIIESQIYKSGDSKIYDLYAGGIAGWSGRGGLDYKSDVAVFNNCTNIGTVVDRSALSEEQAIIAAGIVGVSRSTCYAKGCLVTGQINGTRQVAGIAGLSSQNNQSGSEFSGCVVAAELYNNGAKVTDRSHGAGGIACYVWGDVHVIDCVVMGDITLNVNGSELAQDQRRPVSAMVGYTNNPSGKFQNNFFGGKLTGGEGSDCIVVMLAFTVDHDVSSDEGYDISDNYSYYQYPLHYCSKKGYGESTTPVLTEEQIAEGISFADIVVGDDPTMEVVRTCVGIEVPMLSFVRMDYEWALEQTGGHGYVADCAPTCAVCGKTKVELVHLYDHDCDAVCNSCGVERSVDEHDYGPWTTILQATQTETGLRKTTCSICGHEETDIIPLLSADPPATGEGDSNGQNSAGNASNVGATEQGSATPIIIAVVAGAAVLLAAVVTVIVVKKVKGS